MYKVKVRTNLGDILGGLGAALAVMCLVLGLSFAIIFSQTILNKIQLSGQHQMYCSNFQNVNLTNVL